MLVCYKKRLKGSCNFPSSGGVPEGWGGKYSGGVPEGWGGKYSGGVPEGRGGKCSGGVLERRSGKCSEGWGGKCSGGVPEGWGGKYSEDVPRLLIGEKKTPRLTATPLKKRGKHPTLRAPLLKRGENYK